MLKALRWVLQGGLGLVVLAVMVWSISRLLPVPQAQREALALLQAEPPRTGENAFAAFWLLPYDGLPQTEYARVLAQDQSLQQQYLACKAAALARGEVESDCPLMGESVAMQDWPRVPGMLLKCSFSTPDCLEKVRADPDGYAAALEPQRALLARIAQLPRYSYVDSPFVADATMPFAAYGLLDRPLASFALAHLQGHSDQALAGTCDMVRSGRMLMAEGDNLFAALTGGAMVRSSANLFAQIVAELPRTHPLPPNCAAALSLAGASELNLCNGMRGEFLMGEVALANIPPHPRFSLVFDEGKTVARNALSMGHACGEPVHQALTLDAPLPPAPLLGSPWSLSCAANAMGCVLTSISSPAYASYGGRLQDVGAQLRLVNVLLWMRSQDPSEDAQSLLLKLPERLASPSREIMLTPDGRGLRMSQYDDEKRPEPQVVLPTALR